VVEYGSDFVGHPLTPALSRTGERGQVTVARLF
jgi:hypothetical protein